MLKVVNLDALTTPAAEVPVPVAAAAVQQEEGDLAHLEELARVFEAEQQLLALQDDDRPQVPIYLHSHTEPLYYACAHFIS